MERKCKIIQQPAEPETHLSTRIRIGSQNHE